MSNHPPPVLGCRLTLEAEDGKEPGYVGGITFVHHTDSFSLIGNMDELISAQAELARLQQEEQQLLKPFSDVRATANAQRIKIDTLVRKKRNNFMSPYGATCENIRPLHMS